MSESFQFGLIVLGLETVLCGILAVRSLRLEKFPALKTYLWFAFLTHPILLPLYFWCNSYYGPYWYGLNVFQTLEVFLLTAILGELLGEARKGIYAGALLALGVAFGDHGLSMTIQCVLSVVAGFLSFIEDPRGHVAQGVFVMLVFPLISGYSSEPWAAYIPTVSAVGAIVVWLYAMKFMEEEKGVPINTWKDY